MYEGLSSVSAEGRDPPYVQTMGGAAVCGGDSGGAAYFPASGPGRRVFGVNSRGDILSRSLIATVAPARPWIEDWRTRKGVAICGLDDMPSGCRS